MEGGPSPAALTEFSARVSARDDMHPEADTTGQEPDGGEENVARDGQSARPFIACALPDVRPIGELARCCRGTFPLQQELPRDSLKTAALYAVENTPRFNGQKADEIIIFTDATAPCKDSDSQELDARDYAWALVILVRSGEDFFFLGYMTALLIHSGGIFGPEEAWDNNLAEAGGVLWALLWFL